MKTIKLRRNFSLTTVLMYAALFCVSSYALLEHVSISVSAFSAVKMPLLYMGGLSLVGLLGIIGKAVFRKNHFYVFLSLCALCVLLVFSMYANRNAAIGTSPLRSTVRLILFLMELFLLMMVVSETGRGSSVLKFLYYYVLILVVITDVLLLTGAVRFGYGRHENYLLGTKFSVSYMHMDLLALWVIHNQNRIKFSSIPKWRIILAAVLVLAVSIRIDCMTGVLGCLALVALLMYNAKRNRLQRYSSPLILLMLFICSVLFVFVVEMLVTVPFVNYLIEEILNRERSLTGRMNIYYDIVEKMGRHWWVGYGYGNANTVTMQLFGYANTQNALMQWVLQVGVPATMVLVFVMLQIFGQIGKIKNDNMPRILPLVALIYMFVTIGTVETTFSMSFILWFALIFMLVNEKKEAVRT